LINAVGRSIAEIMDVEDDESNSATLDSEESDSDESDSSLDLTARRAATLDAFLNHDKGTVRDEDSHESPDADQNGNEYD
jgi:hypothetical protein